MKIILSRKGFDSSNGGKPSPILPDGTLLSMPIPSDDDRDTYSDLQYDGMMYSDLLADLAPKNIDRHCHIDPDIRDHSRVNPLPEWKPAFGQIDAAQSVLSNAGVEKGDLFLFFGWFRQIEEHKGHYRYAWKADRDFYGYANLQMIYGYMQIGEIRIGKENMRDYPWHPHSNYSGRNKADNALYLPSEKLSLLPNKKGYGTLNFRRDRVLTMENKSRATWNPYPFLMPEYVYGNRKNSSDHGLYYAGIWQELVIYPDQMPEPIKKQLFDWVETILK